jgi:hypothetical protein
VAVAYQFYSALTPKQDDWIKNAQSLPLIQGTANALVAMLPPNVLERITNLSRPVDENQPGDGTAQPTDQPGVSSGDSNSLGNLSNDATTPAQAPAQ